MSQVAQPVASPAAEGTQQDPAPVVDSDDEAEAGADILLYRDTDKFKTFRKHTRDLYQSISTLETLWPAKSIAVMPYYREVAGRCLEQTLVVGTSSAGQEQNFLKCVTLVQPADNTSELDGCQYDEELREMGAFGMAPSACKLKVDLLMAHDGDVRRARIMQQNPNIIVSSSTAEKIFVFDRSVVLRTAPPNSPPRPQLPLLGPKPDNGAPADVLRDYRTKKALHNQQVQRQEHWDAKTFPGQHRLALAGGLTNAWALDLSATTAGLLVAGGDEGAVTWNLTEVRKTDIGTDVPPLFRTEGATFVNDAKWSPASPFEIACGCGNGSGGTVALFDTRASATAISSFNPQVGSLVNSVDFSQHAPHCIAVGGSDGAAYVFDLRSTAAPTFEAARPHRAASEVAVSWCPHDPDFLATAGGDGNASVVHVPTGTVLFVHTGHQDAVSDVCWSPLDTFAGQLFSVDDHAVCAWKPRNKFFDLP